MKKKFLAFMLMATTLAGSTMTTLAEDSVLEDIAELGQEITGSSTVATPTIKITVPTTADIVINPYQLTYDEDGVTGSSQIISVEQTIKNESNVAVAVNVQDLTTTEVSEGITIATADLTSKNTDKSAFLYLEVIESTATFETKYAKKDYQIIIPNAEGDSTGKTKYGEKDAIVTLAAGDETATEAKFKIGGSVVANPVVVNTDKTETADAWTESDAINVSFKFTFTPQVVTATSES